MQQTSISIRAGFQTVPKVAGSNPWIYVYYTRRLFNEQCSYDRVCNFHCKELRILEVMTTLDCAADSLSSQTVPKFAGSRLTPRAAQKYHQLLLPAVGRAYCPPTAASTAKQLFEQVTLPGY